MDETSFFQSALDSAVLEFDDRLEFDVARVLASTSLQLGVVETLTAGCLTQRLARVAWTSLAMGLTCPTPKAAIHWCGVQPGTIREHGFNSREVTLELASGLKKRAQCDICVAVNGHWGQTQHEQKGLVTIVMTYQGQAKDTQFTLEGHPNSFPQHATQAALLVIKDWINKFKG